MHLMKHCDAGKVKRCMLHQVHQVNVCCFIAVYFQREKQTQQESQKIL